MKILCVGYREWALNIYKRLLQFSEHSILIIQDKAEFTFELTHSYQPDFILAYGWSWIIPSNIVNEYKCIMLHPSPLPSYRGGSPIQNQIINGVTNSSVTLFLMNPELDAGHIVDNAYLSLEGSIQEIFNDIENIGFELTSKFLVNGLHLTPQDSSKASYFKRRQPHESEITQEELQTKPATYLYNKIRMLQDPYPNAYIKTVDNKKLYITDSHIAE